MTPATQIIERLGGTQAVADLLGITQNAVQRWTYPTEPSGAKGDKTAGLGDRVPTRHWAALVARSGGLVSFTELMDAQLAEEFASKAKRSRAAA